MRQIRIKKLMKTTGVTFGTSGVRGLAENMTDGLRMYFENDEIVHLRPSGNARNCDVMRKLMRRVRQRGWLNNALRVLEPNIACHLL